MTEYAVVDIETTGGHPQGNDIIEIAVRVISEQGVISLYETLVRPGRSIPLYITALTGIDDELVAGSPSFDDIAENVFRLLEGRIFVAHNVNFDYSFLKYTLALSGFILRTPKLCTVRMARKIRPGLGSYSLGNLCSSLGINIDNRHRAGGDVEATVTLFSKLLEWDQEGVVAAMLKKGSREQMLPPHLSREMYESLPGKTGVYYFHNDKGKIIYVGKAKNIRKRVAQHFTGYSPTPQRQHFMRNIYSVTYQLCGTELMALILESVEIKRLYPEYNRSLKRYEPRYGLFVYEDMRGYKRMIVSAFSKSLLAVRTFNAHHEGTGTLRELIRRFGLCHSLCRLGNCECHKGATGSEGDAVTCSAKLPPEVYNERVEQALSYLRQDVQKFCIVDDGRQEDEKSCIWVEDGDFYGMGYIEGDGWQGELEDSRAGLARYASSYYIMQLIYTFISKYPHKVVAVE